MTKRASTSYVTTLDVNSASDMQTLETIKKAVMVMNRGRSCKKRVVLRGRMPFDRAFALRTGRFVSYDRGGNIVGGIKNATKLDVYIYDRRD